MGIVSGGGGGGAPTGAAGGDLGGTYPNPTVDLMSGGTVTGRLQVNPTTLGQEALTIATNSGANVSALAINAPHTTVSIDGDGSVRFSSDDGLQAIFSGTSSGSALVGVNSDATDRANPILHTSIGVRITNHGTAAGGYDLIDTNGNRVFAALAAGAVLTAQHAAPADGDLDAGECALWFDQTNGAPKLMAKGKQANGTVVTAAVALA